MRVQSDGIRDWPALVSRLEKQPHVVAASPALYEQVLISRGPRATGAVLKGVLPEYENKTSEILKTVKLGSLAPLAPAEKSAADAGTEENPPIILGLEMATDLGATLVGHFLAEDD